MKLLDQVSVMIYFGMSVVLPIAVWVWSIPLQMGWTFNLVWWVAMGLYYYGFWTFFGFKGAKPKRR